MNAKFIISTNYFQRKNIYRKWRKIPRDILNLSFGRTFTTLLQIWIKIYTDMVGLPPKDLFLPQTHGSCTTVKYIIFIRHGLSVGYWYVKLHSHRNYKKKTRYSFRIVACLWRSHLIIVNHIDIKNIITDKHKFEFERSSFFIATHDTLRYLIIMFFKLLLYLCMLKVESFFTLSMFLNGVKVFTKHIDAKSELFSKIKYSSL